MKKSANSNMQKSNKRYTPPHFIVLRLLLVGILTFFTPLVNAYSADIVTDGSTATTLSDMGNNTTQITTSTTNGVNAYNSFKKFNIATAETVNMILPGGTENLLNFVRDEKSTINGVLNSFKNGKIGGNVFFANPHGFVIGSTGVINVGSLNLSTTSSDAIDNILKGNAVDFVKAQAIIDGTAPLQPGSNITIEGKINATGADRDNGSIKIISDAIEIKNGARVAAGHGTIVDSIVSQSHSSLTADKIERKDDGRIFIVATGGDARVSGEVTTATADTDLYGTVSIQSNGGNTKAGGNTIIDNTAVIDGGRAGEVELTASRDVTINGRINVATATSDTAGTVRVTALRNYLGSAKIDGSLFLDAGTNANFDTGTVLNAYGGKASNSAGKIVAKAGYGFGVNGDVSMNADAPDLNTGNTGDAGDIVLLSGEAGLSTSADTKISAQGKNGLVNIQSGAGVNIDAGTTVTVDTAKGGEYVQQKAVENIEFVNQTINTAGKSKVIFARDSVKLTGTTVDTSATNSNAGSIYIIGDKIEITGSTLTTSAGTAHKSGDIAIANINNSKQNTITLSNTNLKSVDTDPSAAALGGNISIISIGIEDLVRTPNIQVTNVSSMIDISGGSISGLNVGIYSLASTSADFKLDNPAAATPGSSSYETKITSGDLGGAELFAAVAVATAKASIKFDKNSTTTIDSINNLTINANTVAGAKNLTVGYLVGATVASATAQTNVDLANATLSAGNTADISARVNNQVQAIGMVASNTKAKQAGFGVAIANGHSVADLVADGAAITAAFSQVQASVEQVTVANMENMPLAGGTETSAAGALSVTNSYSTASVDYKGSIISPYGVVIGAQAVNIPQISSKSSAASSAIFPAIEGTKKLIDSIRGKTPEVSSQKFALATSLGIGTSYNKALVNVHDSTLTATSGDITQYAAAVINPTGVATGSSGSAKLSIGGALSIQNAINIAENVSLNNTVTAGGGYTVMANASSVPVSTKWKDWVNNAFDSFTNIGAYDWDTGTQVLHSGENALLNIVSGTLDLIGPLMAGDLGLSGIVFNNYVQSSAGSSTQSAVGASFNAGVQNLTNTATAKISGGTISAASINVDAKTSAASIDMAGIWSASSIIAAGVTQGQGSVAGGTFQYQKYNSTAAAIIDNGAKITTVSGDVNVTSSNTQNRFGMVYAGQKSGADSTFSINGGGNFAVYDNDALSQVDSTVEVNSAKDVNVLASNEVNNLNITGGILKGANLGVGLSAAVNTINNKTTAVIGTKEGDPSPAVAAKKAIHSAGNVNISSNSNINNLSIAISGSFQQGSASGSTTFTSPASDLSSAVEGSTTTQTSTIPVPPAPGIDEHSSSIGKGSKFGLNVSGEVNISVFQDDTKAYVKDANITAEKMINIIADAKTREVGVTGGFAKSTSNGVAGNANIVNGNIMSRAYADASILKSNTGSININSIRNDIFATAAANLSVNTGGIVNVAGNVDVLGLSSKSYAYATNGSSLLAENNIYINAVTARKQVMVQGAVGIGTGSAKAGVGLGISIAAVDSDVYAGLQGEPVQAIGSAGTIQNSNNTAVESKNGNIAINAKENSLLTAGTVSMGIGGELNMQGSAVVQALRNRAFTSVGENAVVTATNGNFSQTAFTDYPVILFAGMGEVGSKAGVGASALVLTHYSDVASLAAQTSSITVGGDAADKITFATGTHVESTSPATERVLTKDAGVDIYAEQNNRNYLVAIGGAYGGKVAVASNAIISNQVDTTAATISSNNIASGKDINLTAIDNTVFVAGSGQGALSTGSAGVGAVILVNNLNKKTAAVFDLHDNDVATLQNISIHAFNREHINAIAAGGALAKSFSVAGSANTNVMNIETSALMNVFTGSKIVLDGGLSVLATDDQVVNSLAIGASGADVATGVTVNTLVQNLTTTAKVENATGTNREIEENGNHAVDYLTGNIVSSTGLLEKGVLKGSAVQAMNHQHNTLVTFGGSVGGKISINPVSTVVVSNNKAIATLGTTLLTPDTQLVDNAGVRVAGVNHVTTGLYTFGVGFAGTGSGMPALSTYFLDNQAEANINAAVTAAEISAVTLNNENITNISVGGAPAGKVGLAASSAASSINSNAHTKVVGNLRASTGNLSLLSKSATQMGYPYTITQSSTPFSPKHGANITGVTTATVTAPAQDTTGSYPATTVFARNGLGAPAVLTMPAINAPKAGNIAITLAVGGSGAAGAALATSIVNKDVDTTVGNNVELRAKGGIDVSAVTEEAINSFAVGGAFGGNLGVAGSISTKVINVATDTLVGSGVNIYRDSVAGNINILANNQSKISSAAGMLAAGQVGISTAADILSGKIHADTYIGESTKINNPAGDITIASDINTNIDSFSIAGSGGQYAAVAPAITVVAFGNSISADAMKHLQNTGTFINATNSNSKNAATVHSKLDSATAAQLNTVSSKNDYAKTISTSGGFTPGLARTTLAKNVDIDASGKNTISANNIFTGVSVAGGLGVGLYAGVGLGVNITSTFNHAETIINEGVTIDAGGDNSIAAIGTRKHTGVTIAGSGGIGGGSGAIGVNGGEQKVLVTVLDGAKVRSANGAAYISAQRDLQYITVSGAGSGGAGGVAISVNSNNFTADSVATVNSGAEITASKGIIVEAIGDVAASTVGAGLGVGGAIPTGTANVNNLTLSANATNKGILTSTGGSSVNIVAADDTRITAITGGVSGGVVGLSATAGTNVIKKEVHTLNLGTLTRSGSGEGPLSIVSDMATNGKNVTDIAFRFTPQSQGHDGINVNAISSTNVFSDSFGAGAGVAGGGGASANTTVIKNNVSVNVKNASTISTNSDLNIKSFDWVRTFGGAQTASAGLAAAGSAAVDVAVVNNNTNATMAANTVNKLDGSFSLVSNGRIYDYSLTADAAAGGAVSLAGAIVRHDLRQHSRTVLESSIPAVLNTGSVNINSTEYIDTNLLAGVAGMGGGAGLGGSIISLNIDAAAVNELYKHVTIGVTGDFNMNAANTIIVNSKAISGQFAGGVGVAGGINSINIMAQSNNDIGAFSNINTGNNINIKADNSVTVTSLAGGGSGALAGAAGAGLNVLNLGYLTQSNSNYQNVFAGKDIVLTANTANTVTQTSAAGAAGIYAGVSGAVNVATIGSSLSDERVRNAVGVGTAGHMNKYSTSALDTNNNMSSDYNLNLTKNDLSKYNPVVQYGAVLLTGKNSANTKVNIGEQSTVTAQNKLQMTAVNTPKVTSKAGAGALSGIVGLGGAVSYINNKGLTQAIISNNSEVKGGGDVVISATRDNAGAYDMHLETYAENGGLVGIGASVISLYDCDKQLIDISHVKFTGIKDLTVNNTHKTLPKVYAHSTSVGGAALGASIARIESEVNMQTFANNVVLTGENVEINNTAEFFSTAEAYANAGGLAAGIGTNIYVKGSPVLQTYLSDSDYKVKNFTAKTETLNGGHSIINPVSGGILNIGAGISTIDIAPHAYTETTKLKVTAVDNKNGSISITSSAKEKKVGTVDGIYNEGYGSAGSLIGKTGVAVNVYYGQYGNNRGRPDQAQITGGDELLLAEKDILFNADATMKVKIVNTAYSVSGLVGIGLSDSEGRYNNRSYINLDRGTTSNARFGSSSADPAVKPNIQVVANSDLYHDVYVGGGHFAPGGGFTRALYKYNVESFATQVYRKRYTFDANKLDLISFNTEKNKVKVDGQARGVVATHGGGYVEATNIYSTATDFKEGLISRSLGDTNIVAYNISNKVAPGANHDEYTVSSYGGSFVGTTTALYKNSSTYNAKVNLGNNTDIYAGGSVLAMARNFGALKSDVSTSAGGVGSHSTNVNEFHVVSNANFDIDKDSQVIANKQVSIGATSSWNINMRTHNDSGGVGTGGISKVVQIINMTENVNIGAKVKIGGVEETRVTFGMDELTAEEQKLDGVYNRYDKKHLPTFYAHAYTINRAVIGANNPKLIMYINDVLSLNEGDGSIYYFDQKPVGIVTNSNLAHYYHLEEKQWGADYKWNGDFRNTYKRNWNHTAPFVKGVPLAHNPLPVVLNNTIQNINQVPQMRVYTGDELSSLTAKAQDGSIGYDEDSYFKYGLELVDMYKDFTDEYKEAFTTAFAEEWVDIALAMTELDNNDNKIWSELYAFDADLRNYTLTGTLRENANTLATLVRSRQHKKYIEGVMTEMDTVRKQLTAGFYNLNKPFTPHFDFGRAISITSNISSSPLVSHSMSVNEIQTGFEGIVNNIISNDNNISGNLNILNSNTSSTDETENILNIQNSTLDEKENEEDLYFTTTEF